MKHSDCIKSIDCIKNILYCTSAIIMEAGGVNGKFLESIFEVGHNCLIPTCDHLFQTFFRLIQYKSSELCL